MQYQKMFTLLTAMGANITEHPDPTSSPPCDLECADLIKYYAQDMCMVKWLIMGGFLVTDLRESVIIPTAFKTYFRPRMARGTSSLLQNDCFWQCSMNEGVCPEGASICKCNIILTQIYADCVISRERYSLRDIQFSVRLLKKK